MVIEIITIIEAPFSVAEKKKKKKEARLNLLPAANAIMVQGGELVSDEGGRRRPRPQSRTSAPTSLIHTSSVCLSSLGHAMAASMRVLCPWALPAG